MFSTSDYRRSRLIILFLLFYSLSGECCAPGRRGGRRRSPRVMSPLVFREHVPNVGENSLGASGLIEGHVSKDDPRFNELVPNYNSDIYFRDEEGTGADRLMTERCKERLNMLTISVMNTWPNVRLRVLESWDEDSRHQPNSLHYEGRAVDISTSDRDRSKLGMLARLAVEAGFDWVSYESRAYIHCSVKSETSARKRLGGCFPSDAIVNTPSGTRNMKNLQEGDLVQVFKEDGSLGYSPVLLFLHKDAEDRRSFLVLGTSSGKKITLTPSHLLFILRKEFKSDNLTVSDILLHGESALAGRVSPGDFIVSVANRKVTLDEVTFFNASWHSGVFAPLTKEGTVVVNNIVASCYAVIDSQLIAHWAFMPVRVYYKVKDFALFIINSLGISAHSAHNNINSYEPQAKKWPRTYHKYNRNIISDNVIKTYANQTSSIKREHTPHIHWYAKLLYDIAYYLLPNHLVYS